MIECVISGFQTGVDQHAARAARTCGIKTFGYIPKGFKTEAGPCPDMAEWGASEHWSDAYWDRTEANLLASDGVLVFDGCATRSPGTKLVSNLVIDLMRKGRNIPATFVRCARVDGAWTIASPVFGDAPYLAEWLESNGIRKLFVGGNRESKSPGLGAFIESYLTAVFRLTNPPTE